jgi:chromate reductase
MENLDYNILCVVGGISRNSLNQKVFQMMRERAPEGINLRSFVITRLPYFSKDIENDPPDTVIAWKDMIREADAVLFITPEYNRSFPGVLKNAIDWGSRPYGENLWKGKPAAVMGASTGPIGTFGAQHHLRQVLAYLDVPVMGQPEFYLNASQYLDENGRPKSEKTEKVIANFWHEFEDWIRKFVAVPGTQETYPSQGLEDSPGTTAH